MTNEKIYKMVWLDDSPNAGLIEPTLYKESDLPDHNRDDVLGPHREFVEVVPGTLFYKVFIHNDLDHSIDSYKKAYNLQPGAAILSKILFSYLYLNYNFDEYFYFTKKCRELFNVSNDNFLKLNNNYESTLSITKIKDKVPKKKFKIKVGFISSDLRDHSIGFQVYPVLKELSKKKDIQLFAYYNFGDHDKTNERFKEFFYIWNDIDKCSDLEVVNLIRSQKIDILIDLNGHTVGSRLGVLVQKPAPIQVEWCGYLASIGFTEIDYIIQDSQKANYHTYIHKYIHKYI
jgi:predicted O-linked N-acetylglucosamine transferase (SPINDLY family)